MNSIMNPKMIALHHRNFGNFFFFLLCNKFFFSELETRHLFLRMESAQTLTSRANIITKSDQCPAHRDPRDQVPDPGPRKRKRSCLSSTRTPRGPALVDRGIIAVIMQGGSHLVLYQGNEKFTLITTDLKRRKRYLAQLISHLQDSAMNVTKGNFLKSNIYLGWILEVFGEIVCFLTFPGKFKFSFFVKLFTF